MGTKKILPAQSLERTKELGHRVRLARTRRGMSIAEVAAKAGINRNTLNALELGKPGVALGAYVTVLWALGLDKTLDAVAHPDRSEEHTPELQSPYEIVCRPLLE